MYLQSSRDIPIANVDMRKALNAIGNRGYWTSGPGLGLMQAAFVVVDEHAGCDMLGIYKEQNHFSHIPLSPLFQPMPL